ncbi:Synaptotagmin-like protein 2 [Paramarasmius palmivorus]|uniref:Synaptotagmin-like protein 2 n=1 Tax=Paramarasmius palmivorus TaxID=297713 RepID=A0AAW0C3P1_9AGAR
MSVEDKERPWERDSEVLYASDRQEPCHLHSRSPAEQELNSHYLLSSHPKPYKESWIQEVPSIYMNTLRVLPRLSASRTLLKSPVKAIGARRTFFTIIQQGQEGWRLSFGRNPTQLKPGIALNIPVYHEIRTVDLRESSISIPDLHGYTIDNVPVTLSGSLFFRITDGYKACFQVSDLYDNIRNAGTSSMRAVLGTFSYDQVIGDRNELNKQLNNVIGGSIKNWGVEGTRFEVQQFKPANREVERQLELQMEAERNRRKQLLDTQAQINVAEGHKQRVILESEGLLQAKANEAEANYTTVVRNAEARQQQSILEAAAFAKQVGEVAQSIAADKGNITAEDRQRALEALVELRRLEQLKAIASGKGNSTYFFGDLASMGGSPAAYNIDFAQNRKHGLETLESGGKVDRFTAV